MPEFSSAQSAFNAATMMSVTWADYCSFGGHNDSVKALMTMATMIFMTLVTMMFMTLVTMMLMTTIFGLWPLGRLMCTTHGQ